MTILRLLDAIIPQIPEVVTGSSADEGHIIDFLKKTTMVGLLPVPHPILIRKYQSNSMTDLWFTTFMWGVIYLRNQMPPLFYKTNVKLFVVKVLEPSEIAAAAKNSTNTLSDTAVEKRVNS